MPSTSKGATGGDVAAEPPSKVEAAFIIIGGLAAIGLSLYGISRAVQALQQPPPPQE